MGKSRRASDPHYRRLDRRKMASPQATQPIYIEVARLVGMLQADLRGVEDRRLVVAACATLLEGVIRDGQACGELGKQWSIISVDLRTMIARFVASVAHSRGS